MNPIASSRVRIPEEQQVVAAFALTSGRHTLSAATLIFALLTLPAIAAAQSGPSDIGTIDTDALATILPSRPPYSPYAGHNYPTRPFFGDTHVHTSFSLDAGTAGARLTPADAYRFGKGEEVISSTGQRARLSRALDFMVVADHSDGFGLFPRLIGGDPILLADPQVRRWSEMLGAGEGHQVTYELVAAQSAGTIPQVLAIEGFDSSRPGYRSAWHEVIQAAEEANEPGHFTAFIGYEWTSNNGGDGLGNLHRNVIYRGDGDEARLVDPLTTAPPFGSPNPRELWKWMANYEDRTHGRVLAIAHNGNLSNGRMFPIIESFTGKEIDREYAESRARWEPLIEATQIKGDGEAHPFLSPDDEFADYETWDKGNLDLSEAKRREMLEFEYARAALKNGLRLGVELGVNPYKFGMIGSTDTHTGLATAEEDNFFGKISLLEPSPQRAVGTYMESPVLEGVSISKWEQTASGYAAVWATENTREALFDAMERRETYATTGPRMVVRFFGGWDFVPADATTRMPARAGYAKGVPMGGDLTNAPAGKAPTFLVAALKDPIGANLDRYQIVKGWLDAKGELQEKVYDVVWSGNRRLGRNGKLPAVGSSVNVQEANYTNTIGATELIAVWEDPEFDPNQRAFYYGRVIEIPTPRWTAYDAKYFGLRLPADVPMTTQERAYTSPIWYTP